MYRILSEWDIGAEGKVFGSSDAAYQWLEDNLVLHEMYKDDLDLKTLEEDGLVLIEQVEFID